MENRTVVSAKTDGIIYGCTGIIAQDAVAPTDYYNDRKNIGPIKYPDGAD